MSLTLLSAIKDVTTVLKFSQLGESRTREAQSLVDQLKNEDLFRQYFIEGKTSGLHIPDVSINSEEISCALQLAHSAGQRYQSTPKFTTLRLLPDIEDRFGALKMNSYFVAPSYVDRETYQQREGLLLEETYDPRQLSRRIGGFSHIPQDYVSSSLFGNARRIIVTGNPGVGKSTFSRWLCHQWSNNHMQLSGIPLHVELSQLREEKDNRLCAYLKRIYLPKTPADTIQDTLSQLPTDFLLILDGFDELDAQAQRRLRQDLLDINPEARYVLLSRPYGLIDGPNFVADFGLRIDGFTKSNIETYVSTFLTMNNRGGERASFMRLLQQNDVLADYAHTPLLLSFMVYLFLADDQQFKRLESVYSRYELQHRVFEWLETHEGQKNRVLPKQEILDRSRSTAYEMEITQSLWVDYVNQNNPNRAAAKAISELGLGNLRQLNTNKDRFSFATLTFQEYLAAGFIHDRISAESMAYLSNYKFFWNFGNMLIGGLGFTGKEQTIRQTLDYYLANWLAENRKATDAFLFLTHLAEASPRIIEEYTAGDGIRHCMTAYQLGFYDKNWSQTLLDAFSSVYGKAPLLTKRFIESWLYEAVKSLIVQKVDDKSFSPEMEYAKALIVQLRFHEKEELVAKFVTLLETPVKRGIYHPDTAFTDESFEGISFIFDEIIQAAEGQWASKLARCLRSFILDPDLLELYALNCFKVLARLVTNQEAVSFLENHLKELADQKKNAKVTVECLKACAGGIYICGTRQWDPQEKDTVRLLLRKATDNIIDALAQLDELTDFETGEIGALAIEGLVYFDDPDFYPDLLRFGELTEVQTLSLRVPNATAFFAFFAETLAAVVNKGNLEELVTAIDLVDDIRHQFGRVRKRVGEALVDYVKEHYDSFLDYQSSKDFEFIMATGQPVLPLNQMNQVLQRIIFDPYLVASDRQYLADTLSIFPDVPFFRNYFYPAVWGDEFFQFFRRDYWDYLETYRQSNDTSALLHILSNPTIYTFQGNLPRLKENLTYFHQLPTQLQRPEDQNRLFRVCGYTLGMIQQTYREETALSDDLIRLIEQLILSYNLREVYENPKVLQVQDGKSLLMAPFLYSLSGSMVGNYHIDYEKVFYEKGYESARFSELFIDAFIQDGRLDQPAFNRALQALDDVTANRIKEKLSFKRYLVEPFDRTVFEAILNN